jgi:hypothetical protein
MRLESTPFTVTAFAHKRAASFGPSLPSTTLALTGIGLGLLPLPTTLPTLPAGTRGRVM